jgi:hypothetical protein
MKPGQKEELRKRLEEYEGGRFSARQAVAVAVRSILEAGKSRFTIEDVLATVVEKVGLQLGRKAVVHHLRTMSGKKRPGKSPQPLLLKVVKPGGGQRGDQIYGWADVDIVKPKQAKLPTSGWPSDNWADDANAKLAAAAELRENAMADALSQLVEMQRKFDVMTTERAGLIDKCKRLSDDQDVLLGDIERLEKQLEQRERQCAAYQNTIDRMQGKVNELQGARKDPPRKAGAHA